MYSGVKIGVCCGMTPRLVVNKYLPINTMSSQRTLRSERAVSMLWMFSAFLRASWWGGFERSRGITVHILSEFVLYRAYMYTVAVFTGACDKGLKSIWMLHWLALFFHAEFPPPQYKLSYEIEKASWQKPHNLSQCNLNTAKLYL